MDASHQTNSWLGRTVGDRQRYRITNHLGGGGMGNVFLAVDTLLGQQVAIKMLKERLLGEGDVRQRFEREVLLCAAIHSDHVVQVKDFGITEDGYPFYVMEYLQGQTLGGLLEQEKLLPVERVVRIISQVCEGLHMAHTGVEMWHEDTRTSERVKVVHRDLKPENIFLVQTTMGELVKVLDFGIAKSSSSDVASTSTGLFMGTVQYASPEQLEGSKSLDERADIYSLGMILYEMLSGTDPFGCGAEGHTKVGMRWVRAHISEHPRHLRSQPGCEQIPLKLEAVVMQCLRKSPSGRFSSVEALNHALTEAINLKIDLKIEPKTSVRKQIRNLPTAQHPHDSIDAETIAVNMSILDRSEPPSTQSGTLLTEYLQQKLELVLVQYIGPIAPILLQQVIAQSSHATDLIERLAHHLPASKQVEFQTKAQTLLGTAVTETQTQLTQKIQTVQTIQTTQTIGISGKNSAPEQPSQSFIDRCEAALADAIGPMARLIMHRALEQNPSQSQLIELLVQQIPVSQVAQFRKRLEKSK